MTTTTGLSQHVDFSYEQPAGVSTERVFTPDEFSPNRLERFAWCALQAGDSDAAKWAEREFYREGCEDDCYHEDAG